MKCLKAGGDISWRRWRYQRSNSKQPQCGVSAYGNGGISNVINQ